MLAARRASMPTIPPPNRIAIGFHPRKKATSESPAIAASPKSFIAVLPKRQIASPMTAITAGLIPPSTDAACGRAPNRT
jgi:hypothetical protein